VAWELPLDLPAGDYRLVATGTYWDGEAVQGYTLESAPFAVAHSPETDGKAFLKDGELRLTLEHPAPPAVVLPGTSWLSRGYRLHDPGVGPEGPLREQGPLTLSFTVDDVDDPGLYEATFDREAGAYLFDFAATGVEVDDDAHLEVRYHLSADIVPDYGVIDVKML